VFIAEATVAVKSATVGIIARGSNTGIKMNFLLATKGRYMWTIAGQPEMRPFIAGGAWYLRYTSRTGVTSARVRATVCRGELEVLNWSVRAEDAALAAIAA
jgi:hypothetical protein